MARDGDAPSTYIFGNDDVVICTPCAEDDHKKYEMAPGRLKLYFGYLAKQAKAYNEQKILNLIQKRTYSSELEFKPEGDESAASVNLGDICAETEAFKRLYDYYTVADCHHGTHEEVLRLQQKVRDGEYSDDVIESLLLKKAELEDLKKRDTVRPSDLRKDFERLVRVTFMSSDISQSMVNSLLII